MKSSILFSIVFLFISFATPAQDGGSTLRKFKSFATRGSAENLQTKAEAELVEASSSGDVRALAQAFKQIGLINLRRLYNYEAAMDNFVRALVLEDSLGLKNEMIFTYIAISEVYQAAGDRYKALENLEQAQEINREDDKEIFAYLKIRLGDLYAAVGRTEEAFDSYTHALQHRKEADDPLMEAEALYHQGKLFALQGKYPEALKAHKEALALRRSTADKATESLSLSEIGGLYHLMKNDERALANHVAALEIRQALNNNPLIAASYNDIGHLYLSQQNYERAIANGDLALKLARDSNAQHEMLRAFDLLSQCFKALADYERSLSYKEEYVGLLEFMQNENGLQKILDTQNRFVLAKKEMQISRLEAIRAQREKEIAVQNRFRNVLLSAICLGVVIIVLIFSLYIQKRRSNKTLSSVNEKVRQQNIQLQELNVTKDKFFSIISHDLKGPLNSLTSFSALLINHTDSLSKDEIRMLAKDLDRSLKNLFDLLENLLEWSRSQTGNIEFTPEVFDLNALLLQNRELLQAQAQSKNILLSVDDGGEELINAHKHSINTVVRNLISNAIKFTSPGGTITVTHQMRDGSVVVSVRDTGVGMPPAVVEKLFRLDAKHTTRGTADEKGTGLGLILCRDFIEKNGGTIRVESEVGKGSVFSFSLPVDKSVSPDHVIVSS